MSKVGEEYEKAVYEFTKTLDSNAKVIFDHYVPDKDTGESRQCDVWIEAKFGGLFQMNIYISCKDHSRKLNSGDIDYFLGEMYLRCATNGVIYSKSGFTNPALRKAEKHKISCCRIYNNQPADLPTGFTFEHYVYYPRVQLSLNIINSTELIRSWNDVFNLSIDEKLLVEFVEEEFNNCLENLILRQKVSFQIPNTWSTSFELCSSNKDLDLQLTISGKWKIYKAIQEATLYNGSYCLNEGGTYKGTIIGPAIDTQGSNPGPVWKLIDKTDFSKPANRIIAFFHYGKLKENLITQFGNLPINS